MHKAIAILLLAAVAWSCNSGNKAIPGGNSSGNSGNSGAGQSDVKKTIQNKIADKMNVKADQVEVTILKDADVPGVTVFSTYVESGKKGRPGRYAYGVVTGDGVETDRNKARSIVLKAWNYIPERTVSPVKVANVFGLLEGKSREPSEPILLQKHIDAMSESQKKVLFLPRESTVDGKPAVEYWATSGEVPLWLTTVVIAPDRTVTITKKEHWD